MKEQPCKGSLLPLVDFLTSAGPGGTQILQHDWANSPLGHMDGWPSALQTTLRTVIGSRQPMSLYWGPSLIQFFNDAYMTMLGDRATGGIGAPLWEFWADIADDIRPIVEEALSGKSTWIESLPLMMTRNGAPEKTFWSFSYIPVYDFDASIAGFMNICTDMTTAVRAVHDRQTSSDLLMEMFQQSPSFLAILREPEHRIEFVNANYMTLIGHREVLGLTVKTALPDIVARGHLDMLGDVYRSGKAHHVKSSVYVLQAEPGGPTTERHIEFVFQAITDAEGLINGVLVEGHDVTDLENALSKLAASEGFLQSILNSSRDCIKVLNQDGAIVFMNQGGNKVLEMEDDESIIGRAWTDLWADSGNIASKTAISNATNGINGRFEGYAKTMRGSNRYWDVQVTPIFEADGSIERILVVSRDITDLKELEIQRTDLMQEMSHRLKNSLTLVQAITSQTFQYATSMVSARDAIAGRISALGRSQDILITTDSAISNIEKLMAVVLAPHREAEDRFRLSGPPVMLSQKQALGLSLALHELATNAMKYGALSNDDGHVEIEWTLSPEFDFDLRWTECGGPPFGEPTRKGFGSRLVERIVAAYFDGKTELTFKPTGVMFTLQGRVAMENVKNGDKRDTRD